MPPRYLYSYSRCVRVPRFACLRTRDTARVQASTRLESAGLARNPASRRGVR